MWRQKNEVNIEIIKLLGQKKKTRTGIRHMSCTGNTGFNSCLIYRVLSSARNYPRAQGVSLEHMGSVCSRSPPKIPNPKRTKFLLYSTTKSQSIGDDTAETFLVCGKRGLLKKVRKGLRIFKLKLEN